MMDSMSKSYKQFISSSWTHIWNKLLSSWIISPGLKYSEIKPLFKKGDRNSMANNRLIPLLTAF